MLGRKVGDPDFEAGLGQPHAPTNVQRQPQQSGTETMTPGLGPHRQVEDFHFAHRVVESHVGGEPLVVAEAKDREHALLKRQVELSLGPGHAEATLLQGHDLGEVAGAKSHESRVIRLHWRIPGQALRSQYRHASSDAPQNEKLALWGDGRGP